MILRAAPLTLLSLSLSTLFLVEAYDWKSTGLDFVFCMDMGSLMHYIFIYKLWCTLFMNSLARKNGPNDREKKGEEQHYGGCCCCCCCFVDFMAHTFNWHSVRVYTRAPSMTINDLMMIIYEEENRNFFLKIT